MRQSTKIIVNVSATWVRAALTGWIGLVVVRLGYNLLGKEDWGLAIILGAAGGFLTVLGDGLIASARRHMAYEIGRGDAHRLAVVFNTTLAILLVLALALLAIGLALAWPILSALNIPPGREAAARWVYLLTVGGLFITTSASPFLAMLHAQQALVTVAIFRTIRPVLLLCGLILLLRVPVADNLVAYSLLITVIAVVMQSVWVAICLVRYPGCRPNPALFRRSEIRPIVNFAGWTLCGEVMRRLYRQGAALLFGIWFLPGVAGAYGFAMILNRYVHRFNASILQTTQPAMTTVEGRGGQREIKLLVQAAGKYPTSAALLFLIPTLVEIETVLGLWVGQYPPYAPLFARLVLATTAMVTLAGGYNQAILARGQARLIALWLSIPRACLLLVVALMFYLFPRLEPWVLPLANLGQVAVSTFLIRPIYFGRIIGMPAGRWWAEVVWPVSITAACAFGAAVLCRELFINPWLRVSAVVAATAIVVGLFGWFVISGDQEKQHFRRVFKGAWAKIARCRGAS